MIYMNEKKINQEKIAELVGILLGDGSLSLKNGTSTAINRLKITLNSKEDIEYLGYVKNLLREVFGMEPYIRFRKNENAVDVLIFKKEVITYLIEKVGLKLSPKWGRAVIPQPYDSLEYGWLVIRGYFDTDGCLVTANNNGTIYPRLEMKVCPSPMQGQFISLLKQYKFTFGAYPIGKGKIRIQLNGKKQLLKWMDCVGFSNPKHSKKIRRFGMKN